MSLVAELRRRNVIRMAGLYLVGAWLLVQVAGTLFPVFEAPPWVMKTLVGTLALGFVPALIFSWVFELTPEGLKRDAEVPPEESIAPQTARRMDRTIIAVLVLALGYFAVDKFVLGPRREAATAAAASAPQPVAAPAPAAAKRSIAVLPFVNMSADPENEFFADGLSEEILNSLVTIEGLRVTGRTSSFQFKGKNEDLRRIGEALGVANVLEGSVRRAGEQVRITAQLVRAADGFHLWSETYDRDVKDTFKVQLDIAQKVTGALDIVLDEAQQARMAQTGVRDVEAYIHYEKAVAFYNAAHEDYIDIALMEQGYAEFGRAIEREPRFAAAYYERTDYYAHLLGQNRGNPAEQAELHRRYEADLGQAAQLATAAPQRASIEVDSILISGDWRALPKQVEALLATEGCIDPVWIDVAAPFVHIGRLLAWRQRLRACDPLNAGKLSQVAQLAIIAGQPEEALEVGEFMHSNGLPQNLGGMEVPALLALGKPDEARRRAAAVDPWLREFKELQVEAYLGDRKAAGAALARWLAQPRAATNISADNRIGAHAVSGDREGANAIAAALDANPIGPMMLLAATTECMCGAPFDIERTPRFKARLAETGWTWPPADVLHYKSKDW